MPRRRSSSLGAIELITPLRADEVPKVMGGENQKMEEGMRKLLAAQQQYDRMKEMTERATKGYLKRFSRRLEKGSARIPGAGVIPADLKLPESSSVLTPRAPMSAKRMSVVYQNHFITPLSPTRSEAQLNMSTGHKEDFLNKFLEVEDVPSKKKPVTRTRPRSGTWAPDLRRDALARSSMEVSEADAEELVVMAEEDEEDSSDEEEEASASEADFSPVKLSKSTGSERESLSGSLPSIPQLRKRPPKKVTDPRLHEEDSDTFESSSEGDASQVVVAPVPVTKLADQEVKTRLTLELELVL